MRALCKATPSAPVLRARLSDESVRYATTSVYYLISPYSTAQPYNSTKWCKATPCASYVNVLATNRFATTPYCTTFVYCSLCCFVWETELIYRRGGVAIRFVAKTFTCTPNKHITANWCSPRRTSAWRHRYGNRVPEGGVRYIINMYYPIMALPPMASTSLATAARLASLRPVMNTLYFLRANAWQMACSLVVQHTHRERERERERGGGGEKG